MSVKKQEINYPPIPGPKRNGESDGYIALSIYPPGTWFNSPDYKVFVGGCGVGTAKTLSAARKLLVQRAKESLLRRIDNHEKLVVEYKQMLSDFEARGGLGKGIPGKP